MKSYTGEEIRDTFIKFFVDKGHTHVPSASLVPGGDQTLLFTNAGMVPFKNIFLGTEKSPYKRVVDSQKCLRVSGKHNDLDEVGRDNTHHTFFEMLGNWSFGDYYKKEAIAWAWELLTEVWSLPKDRLYTTCFEDEKGEIERDDEAANYWRQQPGFDPSHVLFFGRKDNFWEMADTGPCGPDSEIHLDRGLEYCDMRDKPGHVCQVNGDCTRFLELWNLVFIQYNRLGPNTLEPLPTKHVDTGMGFERIVSVLQNVDSNYKIDLFESLLDMIQELTGDNDNQREEHLTSYRVIADHVRAASFLIADRVVPGNTGRNYVCRMIIRRAARFAGKVGLTEPFMAEVAKVVINNYVHFYPELVRNRATILDNITREEKRFQRTLESGVTKLENLLHQLAESGGKVLPGRQAFELYATYGLPLEITRDIAREANLGVDEVVFHQAMEEHRLASGAGEAFGPTGGEGVDLYQELMVDLQNQGMIDPAGVIYDPYQVLEIQCPVIGLLKKGVPTLEAQPGEKIEVLLPETCFYIESGGQVSDTGMVTSTTEPPWEIRIDEVRKPIAGVIVHMGEVISGYPKVGDEANARVDAERRGDIMRNHTATHLLHAELHFVLGQHARQAGSSVGPDRFRFDFTHPEAITSEQLEQIEAGVNQKILSNYPLNIKFKPLQQAMDEGAMALFGEKYGEIVRTISISDFSYELCGGTHVSKTGDISIFIITSEGSAAAGIRRIEAVTGRGAYELIQRRFRTLKETAHLLVTNPEDVPAKTQVILDNLTTERKQTANLRRDLAIKEFDRYLENPGEIPNINGIPVLAVELPGADIDTLRQMADRFRQVNKTGVISLGSNLGGKPMIVSAITNDLVKRGLDAVQLAKYHAKTINGGGGGRPTLAQAGGKEPGNLAMALNSTSAWVQENLK